MDSSVVFNLREIMNLEQERIAAEHAAAQAERERAGHEREALARAAQARAEAERDAEHELARAQEAAAAKARAQREESLLRVRLDVEARERIERERIAAEHAVRAQALAHGRTRRNALTVIASALVAAALCSAVYLAIAPSLQAAARRSAELAREAQTSAAEVSALRRQLNQLQAGNVLPASTASTTGTPSIASPSLVNAPPPHRPEVHSAHGTSTGTGTHGTTRSITRSDGSDPGGLEELLDDPGYDPLTGIGEPAGSRTR